MIEILLCIWNMSIAQGYYILGIHRHLLVVDQIVKIDEIDLVIETYCSTCRNHCNKDKIQTEFHLTMPKCMDVTGKFNFKKSVNIKINSPMNLLHIIACMGGRS